MFRLIFSVILAVALVSSVWRWFSPPPSPVLGISSSIPRAGSAPAPEVTARHIFIWDQANRIPLYAKSATNPLHPASTTKMMTALVVLDNYALDREMVVTRSYPEGTDIGLVPGESTTVERLLYALLIQSANDAAEVLAENFIGGRTEFVAAMNKKAAELKLSSTTFKNPTGLDEEGHLSTAMDLARLADEFMSRPQISRIVSAETAVLSTSGSAYPHIVSNTNLLLGKVPGVLGAKTGYTDLAGQALVTLVSRDDHPVIIAVVGSTDRFGDTTKLIDWLYSNFTW